MEKNWNKRLGPGLWAAGGGLVGLAYYYAVGCAGGSCPISASPARSVIYMALIGLLMYGAFGREWSKCSM